MGAEALAMSSDPLPRHPVEARLGAPYSLEPKRFACGTQPAVEPPHAVADEPPPLLTPSPDIFSLP